MVSAELFFLAFEQCRRAHEQLSALRKRRAPVIFKSFRRAAQSFFNFRFVRRRKLLQRLPRCGINRSNRHFSM